MANVSGLNPQQDRPEAAAAKKARVLLNTSGSTERFTPQARPVDRFVQAPGVERDTQTEQLLSALSGFGGSLARAGGVVADNMRDQAEIDATKDLESMTFEEAKELVDTGVIDETANPYYQAAFMRQYGTRTAMEQGRALTDYLANDFNPEEDDIDEVIAEMATQNTQGVTNEFYLKGFNEVFEHEGAKARDEVALVRAQIRKRETLKGVSEVFNSEINRMSETNMTPAQIHTALRAHYKGNHKLLNTTPEEQDAALLNTVQALIQDMKDPYRDFEIVEELLTGKRGGPLPLNQMEGAVGRVANELLTAAIEKRGELNREITLNQQRSYWEEAEIGAMDEKAFTEWHDSRPGVLSREQYHSYLRRNRQAKQEQLESADKERRRQGVMDYRFSRMEEWMEKFRTQTMHTLQADEDWMAENGDPSTISKSQIEDSVIDYWFNADETGVPYRVRFARDRGMNEQELLDWEVDTFAGNGLEHVQLKSLLENGVSGLDFTEFMDGQPSENVLAGLTMYKRYDEKHPNYLKSLLSADTRKFYESASVAMDVLRLDPSQAALLAQRAVVNLNGGTPSPVIKSRYDEITTALAGIDMSGLANSAELLQDLDHLSGIMATMGSTPEQARKTVTDYLERRYINYNGMALPARADGVNAETVPLLDTVALAYFMNHPEEMNAEGIEDVEQLTVVPLGDNGQRFILAKMINGFPHPVEDIAEGTFDIADLRDVSLKELVRIQDEAYEEFMEEYERDVRRREGILRREEKRRERGSVGGGGIWKEIRDWRLGRD